MAIPVKTLRRGPAPAGRTAPAPTLRVVRPPHRVRARVPFFAVCLAILFGAMLGALTLNTSMARSAYEMHSTELELARTLQSNQERAATVDQLSSPGSLAERAKALGMVPGEGVTYIDLQTGLLLPATPEADG